MAHPGGIFNPKTYYFVFKPLSLRAKQRYMETKKSTFLYWVLFFASVAAFFLVLAFKGELTCWTIPFVCYSFVKALDII
jgi:hypothetical protein